MSKEYFTTEYDNAMRTAIISIAEQLYEGSQDIRDADLIELNEDNVSSAIPYIDNPSLVVKDMDSTRVFTLSSSLSASKTQPRKMDFSASVTELEAIDVPSDLLSTRVQGLLDAEGLTAVAVEDCVEIRKGWAYRALANQEKLIRNPYTVVTIGEHSLFLYPGVSPKDQFTEPFLPEPISMEGLSRLPVPSEEELGVDRFNRIIGNLGFAELQIRI